MLYNTRASMKMILKSKTAETPFLDKWVKDYFYWVLGADRKVVGPDTDFYSIKVLVGEEGDIVKYGKFDKQDHLDFMTNVRGAFLGSYQDETEEEIAIGYKREGLDKLTTFADLEKYFKTRFGGRKETVTGDALSRQIWFNVVRVALERAEMIPPGELFQLTSDTKLSTLFDDEGFKTHKVHWAYGLIKGQLLDPILGDENTEDEPLEVEKLLSPEIPAAQAARIKDLSGLTEWLFEMAGKFI